MKKTKICSILLIILSIIMINTANAACDYETQVKLATEAATVKVNYEILEVIMNSETGLEDPNASAIDVSFENSYYFADRIKITLLNITDNMKIKISADNGFEKEITYADTNNGQYELNGGYAEKIINYTFSIIATNPDCQSKELLNIPLITPKKNAFSDLMACDGVDKYYCKEFIDYEIDMTEQELLDITLKDKMEKEENTTKDEEKTWLENLGDFIAKNYLIFVIIGIIIIGAAIFVIIRKQRSKVI